MEIFYKKKLTHSTSFTDLEMVPILFLDFHTRGYLGRGPFAAHTYDLSSEQGIKKINSSVQIR